MNIGYLGPRGTFSEKAVRSLNLSGNLIEFMTIQDIFLSIKNNIIDVGVAPIENSIEGIVNATIDSLIFYEGLYINKQVVMPIQHYLMTNISNNNAQVDKILSHPQALAQCRHFLLENYPNIEQVETSSTAKAAEIVSNSKENLASICTDICSEIYNLKTIKKDIQNNNNNKTYFIAISKEDTSVPKNHKKMSLAFSTMDRPGALYKILDIFALWDINITQISSRPMFETNGDYVFYVETEITDNILNIKDAITMIKRKTSFFKILGTYDVILN